MIRRAFVSALAAALAAVVFLAPAPIGAQAALPTPEQFAGHPIGADNKLVRWDRIVEYMKLAAQATDRVRLRELGKSTNGQPFIALEISAPDTLKNIDRYKQLERKLYFQGGAPTDAERDEIFRSGKAVVLVTCSIHATEIGASQMTLELVHRLATDDSPATRKVLDNVIFILVPSLNPDGQIMVTDWFNKNAGTRVRQQPDSVPLPPVRRPRQQPRHVHVHAAGEPADGEAAVERLVSVGLARRAPDGQQRRAHLRDAGDRSHQPERASADLPLERHLRPVAGGGARSGGQRGHHLQLDLHELLAGRDGLERLVAQPGRPADGSGERARRGADRTAARAARRAGAAERRRTAAAAAAAATPAASLPPPTDVNPRTEYPRPWLGGRWTLRDIVDYELIATIGLLETAADRRETLLRQIYEVNRETVEAGRRGDPAAILIPVEGQHDPRQAGHLVEKLQMAGVDVHRATSAFEADGVRYGAGTFIVPMAQVFARYARDILERQTYPEVRRAPNAPPEPPYDVSAWSLGMLMGVDHVVVKSPLAATVAMEKLGAAPAVAGKVEGSGHASRSTTAARMPRSPSTGCSPTGRRSRSTRRATADGRSGGSSSAVLRAVRSTRSPPISDSPRRPRRRGPSRRRGSGCTTPGTAATWTKAGRGGCWSSTASARRDTAGQASPRFSM